MKKATYRLSDHALDILHRTMEAKGITTENRAIEYILSEYDRSQSMPEEIVELFSQVHGSEIRKAAAAVSNIERICQILLDVVNTMAIEQNLSSLAHTEYDKAPIVKESEQLYRDKAIQGKQRRDNLRRKRKEG